MDNQQKPFAIARPTIQTLIGVKTSDLLWTAGLTLLAIITPAIFAHTPHNQWLVGTLVNATLFGAAYRLAFGNAFLVAALPSSIALYRGLLPPFLATLIPFIIFSNLLLIVTFRFLRKKMLVGVVTASLVKFVFLYSVTLITVNFLASQAPQKLIVMLQWPQLITALAGGLLASGTISFYCKKVKKV